MSFIQNKTAQIVNSGQFRYFILTLIIISGIIVGLETYPTVYNQFAHIFFVVDQIIIYIFLAELILKLLSHGSKPWVYFQDPWNVFDFIVIAVCFIPNIDTHFVTVLRLARILRVFRIISILPKLQLLVNALLKSIPSMGYVFVLLFLVFYIYAVIGSFIFGKNDPVHFGSLHASMITLFKVLTLEGWTDIMNIQLFGTANPTSEYLMKPGSFASMAYFVSFIVFGAMIIMNLFIGVIMNSMQESQDDLKKMLMKNQKPDSDGQALLKELENKIDELKLDIQKISKSLK
ncbi:MAG: ion transporter [Bacteroidetes bacterium]|nr:ion transporter [Bacteroidota bacterium]